MSESSNTRLHQKIEKALGEKAKRTALYTAMKRGRDNRRKAIDLLPGGEAFRKQVRATKLRCLAKQDDLVERFAEKVRQRGAAVLLAEDGRSAIDYILEVAAKRNAKIVAKSKSLTSEEIEVNAPLESAGIPAVNLRAGVHRDRHPLCIFQPGADDRVELLQRLGFLAFGETLVPLDILGMALVGAALVIARTAPRQRAT